MNKKTTVLSKALDGDVHALLAVSRKGLSPAQLRGYANKSPYTYTELVTMLGMTKRSLKKVKKGYRRYNQDASSCILLFMILLNKVMKKYKKDEAVRGWFEQNDPVFKRPRKHLLNTPLSIQHLTKSRDIKE